ncbi:redoxin domain-containing protein [Pelagibius litoralis]|uniref:Redoxin domain-containing protein n=1 Tax=Pelagibius litoralis TaxID=374515 RepID=A0A967C5M6_9PROT|nr:2OG-Fe(II) oxygenase [Pelagibius litoralis]NIA68985.1 redoxin domain-containing protein [Pelagibius litoralis]
MAVATQEQKPFQGVDRLEAGDRIRPFSLPDPDGKLINPLFDHLAGKPLVLIFECAGSGPSYGDELSGLTETLESSEFAPGGQPRTAVVLAVTRRSLAANRALQNSQTLPFPILADAKAEVYRACGLDPQTIGRSAVTFVLDANLRMVAVIDGGGATRGAKILTALESASEDPATTAMAGHPPVLVLPRTLTARDCADLIDYWHRPAPVWEAEGLNSRGFEQETGDFMVRNKDYGKVLQRVVRDGPLQKYLDAKIHRRVMPEIRKAFQTKVSRREEYRIAGYDAAEDGSLGPHRDNPTKETRHRRFTLSVALNAGDFEGGALRFGEYSQQGYRVPTGTAIVWSCTLLHDILPVTAGRRFILGTHLFGN